MKKVTILILLFAAFYNAAKAQTNDIEKLLKVDSIKVFPDYTTPFKKLPPLSQINLQDYKLQVLTNNFIVLDKSVLPNNLKTSDNMPVAKLNSLDRMPILKLGDTETTHYTMLIKPVNNIDSRGKLSMP